MLALFGPLGATEMIVIAIVAILVFGKNLPEVIGQVAAFVARARRSLTDLRRETGIDREIREARRAVEETVPNIGEWKSPSRALDRRVREAIDIDGDLAGDPAGGASTLPDPERSGEKPEAAPEPLEPRPATGDSGPNPLEPPKPAEPASAEDGEDDESKNAG